jgi:hypothetical protein
MPATTSTTTTKVHTPTGVVHIPPQTTPDVLMALQADKSVTLEGDKPLPTDLTTKDIYVHVVVSLEGGANRKSVVAADKKVDKTLTPSPADTKGTTEPTPTTTAAATTTESPERILAALVKAELLFKLQEIYTAPSEDTAEFILQVYVTMVSTTNTNKLIGRGGGNCKGNLEWFLASRATTADAASGGGVGQPHPAEIFKAGRLSKQALAVFDRNKCLTDRVVPDMVQELVRAVGVGGLADTILVEPPAPVETEAPGDDKKSNE